MSARRKNILRYCSILLLIFVVSLLHFKTSTDYQYLHEIYQRVYYLPILLAAYWFGPLLGILAAAFTGVIYVFHIQLDWHHVPVYSFSQYIEILMYHLVALVTGFLAQKDRRQREKLERTSQELAEAYEKLKTTFEQLRQADRLAALGQLSAGIAHEIRNPLGSIKGSIEILEGEMARDHPKHEFIKIIKEETNRLNAIVAEFLKFARPARPSVEPTSISELIDSTLTLFQKEAQQANVAIVKRTQAQPPPLNLDADQMRQVLLNVVLNGLQAMPEGGVLEVSSGLGPDGKTAVVEISDTGTGIEAADLDHVFDPFFTTKPQGTGLGLSISYQLVENHGGKITVRKNETKGVTFRIELPVEQR